MSRMNKFQPFLGVEEEFFVVRDRDYKLHDASKHPLHKELNNEFGDAIYKEFFDCQWELRSIPCKNIEALKEDVGNKRQRLIDVCSRYNKKVLMTGTHPAAKWDKIKNYSGKGVKGRPRYKGLARRYLINGLHVHIGFDPKLSNKEENQEIIDKYRIEIYNNLTIFQPLLLALCSSSPFWRSVDMELQSYRRSVFSTIPFSGLSPYLDDAKAESFMNRHIEKDDQGRIPHKFWTIRFHERLPTVEIRVMDAEPDFERLMAVCALLQCLSSFIVDKSSEVSVLEKRFDYLSSLTNTEQSFSREEALRQLSRSTEENMWRTQRNGVRANLINVFTPYFPELRDNEEINTRALIEKLVIKLRPQAVKLGCEDELNSLSQIASSPNSASRQLSDIAEHTDLLKIKKKQARNIVKREISIFEKSTKKNKAKSQSNDINQLSA